MYKQNGSKSRRSNRTSKNKHVRHSSNRGSTDRSGGRYKSKRRGSGNWGNKNRRLVRSKIAHSTYISEAIEQTPEGTYIPEHNFSEFGLSPVLATNISDVNYINPTKIQDQAIPQILNGKDLLGIASTGSGKTGPFLIPMIDMALRDKNNRILIVTPTRELASQIQTEFRKFAKSTNLKMTLVIGGENIRTQIHLLKNKPQFVVATPGRLMDLERRNKINLKSFNTIVLDEVDQMLDMGFVADIKLVISKLAEQRQSLFFSATMSQKEETLANTLLKDPIKLEVHKQSPLKSIHQDIVKIKSKGEKLQVLYELLGKTEFHKVLIFSGTKMYADKISTSLRQQGFKADSLHGGKSQNKRSKVLNSFRQDRIDVLVATDVAARGIDIPDISHVINYDEPASVNDYIHRIGRTGRIGKKGTALTFVLGKWD